MLKLEVMVAGKSVSMKRGSDGVMGGKGMSAGLWLLGVCGDEYLLLVEEESEWDVVAVRGGMGRGRAPAGLREFERDLDVASGGGANADGGKVSLSLSARSLSRLTFALALGVVVCSCRSSLPRLCSLLSILNSTFGLSIFSCNVSFRQMRCCRRN